MYLYYKKTAMYKILTYFYIECIFTIKIKPDQNIIIFGKFCSLFYFKFKGNFVPTANNLSACQTLHLSKL